jgi:hypothetical protein
MSYIYIMRIYLYCIILYCIILYYIVFYILIYIYIIIYIIHFIIYYTFYYLYIYYYIYIATSFIRMSNVLHQLQATQGAVHALRLVWLAGHRALTDRPDLGSDAGRMFPADVG